MIDFFEDFKIRMSQVYFIMIFTILAMYVHNGYFDLVEAKGNMLLWTTLVYVVVIILSYILICIRNHKINAGFWATFDIFECCLLAFAFVSVMSVAVSPTRLTAFWGSDGCCIGALTIILLCLSCIFMKRYLELEKWMTAIMAVSGIIIFVLGITDCFDLDIMGWHKGIAASHFDFLSTIGNRDYYDGYLALTLPFFAVLLLFEKDKIWHAIYGLFLVLGFINMYIVKNDGNLLIFGCGIFLVYYILKEKVSVYRVIELLVLFIVASIIVEFICIWIPSENVVGNSIMGMLQDKHWYIALCGLVAVMCILRKKTLPYNAIRIWIGFSIVIVLLLFVVVVTEYDLSFATDRGYIWSYGMETFSKSPIGMKMFGWGTDCYKNAIYTIVGERIVVTWPESTLIANAHNEIVQYLVTMGLFGVLAYIAIYGITLFSKSEKVDVFVMASRCGIFAYFCTALGNNPNGLNYGILFVMLALANKNRLAYVGNAHVLNGWVTINGK